MGARRASQPRCWLSRTSRALKVRGSPVPPHLPGGTCPAPAGQTARRRLGQAGRGGGVGRGREDAGGGGPTGASAQGSSAGEPLATLPTVRAPTAAGGGRRGAPAVAPRTGGQLLDVGQPLLAEAEQHGALAQRVAPRDGLAAAGQHLACAGSGGEPGVSGRAAATRRGVSSAAVVPACPTPWRQPRQRAGKGGSTPLKPKARTSPPPGCNPQQGANPSQMGNPQYRAPSRPHP
jgi:hypothetical protein